MAEEGHEKVVKLLLGQDGILVNPANWAGITPLHAAAEERHGKIVEMLLRKEQVRAMGWNGWRPHRRITATKRPLPLAIGHAGPRNFV